MHVSSDRDLVEIRKGTAYYQLDECFSYKGSSSMMRIYLLQDYVVGSEVSECVKRPIHTSVFIGPQSKLCKEIGGLEGRPEVRERPLTIYEQHRYCRESRIAFELILFVMLVIFPLV